MFVAPQKRLHIHPIAFHALQRETFLLPKCLLGFPRDSIHQFPSLDPKEERPFSHLVIFSERKNYRCAVLRRLEFSQDQRICQLYRHRIKGSLGFLISNRLTQVVSSTGEIFIAVSQAAARSIISTALQASALADICSLFSLLENRRIGLGLGIRRSRKSWSDTIYRRRCHKNCVLCFQDFNHFSSINY